MEWLEPVGIWKSYLDLSHQGFAKDCCCCHDPTYTVFMLKIQIAWLDLTQRRKKGRQFLQRTLAPLMTWL